MGHFCCAGLLVVALVGVVSAHDETPPGLKVSELANNDDNVKVEVTEGKTLLRFDCPLLRGNCKATAENGKWPENIALMLDGLSELKHFEVTTGRMHVQGSRNVTGSFSLYCLGDDREFGKRSLVGTANVRVERQKTGILVTFPARFFGDAETASLGWIDFLRR